MVCAALRLPGKPHLPVDQILNANCLDVMRTMPDESVRLLLTDPPYQLAYRSKQSRFGCIANDKGRHDLIEQYLAECYRILQPDCAAYVFNSWHHSCRFRDAFERHFKLANVIVWVKDNHGPGDLKAAYSPKHELILFGHKGRPLLRGKRMPDVIEYPKVAAARLTHPTEKPVGLLKQFILNSSDPGDIVFDGMCGTGAVAVAAAETGRKFICCELESTFAEIARRRVKEAQRPGQKGGDALAA
jgi:site-specific DNA-methyltransferase (adenine-specific)